LKIRISRGNVAAQLMFCGIFNNHVIANCPWSVPVNEFLKSVTICEKYGQSFSGTLFYGSRCRRIVSLVITI